MLRLKIILVLLLTLSVVILAAIIGSSIQTPFYILRKVKSNVSYFMPQGWAFFTRDARETRVYAYTLDKHRQLKRLNIPGSSARYLFGLDRHGRKVPVEYLSMIKVIDSTKWVNGHFDSNEILKFSLNGKSIQMTNNAIQPTCCGEVILVKTSAIPWAWSKFDNIKMSAKMLKLYVHCPKIK